MQLQQKQVCIKFSLLQKPMLSCGVLNMSLQHAMTGTRLDSWTTDCDAQSYPAAGAC